MTVFAQKLGLRISVGSATLTPRELEVAILAAKGLLAKEIAHEFGTSEQTVKNQFTSLYQKIGADNKLELIYKLGWIHIPEELRNE